MKLIIWFFSFIYELFIDFLLSLVGHRRTKESFERREKIFKPYRAFLRKYLGIKLKDRVYKEKSKDKPLSYKIISLILLILLIFLIRYSVIEPYKIPSGSMIPSLKIGDHIFVNKLAYGLRLPFLGQVLEWEEPKRGDVVVFYPPLDHGKIYVKRLVGLPGDKIRIDDDILYINDELIMKEIEVFSPIMDDVTDKNLYNILDYNLYIENLKGVKHFVLLNKDRSRVPYRFDNEIIVPEDSYFFMGDNRDHSEDSRFWGFVKKDSIRGEALFIWLSFDWNHMFTPSWIRYNRLGKFVK